MEEATDDVINNQIPQIVELVKKGELSVDNIDVFCEKGVFDADATRRILEAGKAVGMVINFHGDELHPMKSGEVGGEIKMQFTLFYSFTLLCISSQNLICLSRVGF